MKGDEMEERKVLRDISDLGASAYLLMHGFKVVNRTDKTVVFEIYEREGEEFEDKQREYLRSEFHRFDSCLMSLKKWRASRYK